MVDPVVRAKLADTLRAAMKGRCPVCCRVEATAKDWETFPNEGDAPHLCWDGYCPDSRLSPDDIRADALLGLPPSVRASLVGIELEEEPRDHGTAEITAYILTDDLDEAERFCDAVADAAMEFDNAGAVGRLAPDPNPHTRYVTPWLPAETPVGVAGRNQPNPKGRCEEIDSFGNRCALLAAHVTGYGGQMDPTLHVHDGYDWHTPLPPPRPIQEGDNK